MVRTVIIDDEPRNIKLIVQMVREYCPNLEIVGTSDSLPEALQLLQELKPSLLLLDIEFPTGTIFPVLEKLMLRDFQIIFITAHNNYATEAFRQNAVDYILKPVTPEALVNAVRRAESKLQNATSTDVSKLLEVLKTELNRSKKIPLPSSEGILFIDEVDIVRCEGKGRYTTIYQKDKKKLTVTKTLKEMEGLLPHLRFLRVHHSHIINLSLIKKYHHGRGGRVELTDGSLVEVSSSRKDELLNILLHRPAQ